jgi:hypothetical protein
MEALCNGFMDLELQYAEEKTQLDRVLVCTMVWLMLIIDKYIPMPLISPMVMDRVWKELKSVEEGYSEVSDDKKNSMESDLQRKIRHCTGLRVSLTR